MAESDGLPGWVQAWVGKVVQAHAHGDPGPLPLLPNLTNPTLGTRKAHSYASFGSVSGVGFSNHPDNLTLLPDEKDDPASGCRGYRRVTT
jgi:hypothetical protein